MTRAEEQIFLICRDPFNSKDIRILSVNPILILMDVDFYCEDGYPEYNIEVISTEGNTYECKGIEITYRLTTLPSNYWGCTNKELSEIMKKGVLWYQSCLELINNKTN